MRSEQLEAYLSRLGGELRKQGLVDGRILEEAREHLIDAMEDGLRRGLSVDAAQCDAFVRFGAPETVAAQCAAERYHMLNRLRFILTNFARRVRRNDPDVGEYDDGATIAGLQGSKGLHYHDVVGPSRYHAGLRLRRRIRQRFQNMSPEEQRGFVAGMKERGEDTAAFETDPRERLVQFLRTFGPRTLGPYEILESLTLLEDTTDSTMRGGRYLAAFNSGTRMIWTVALGADGAVSFDGTGAPA